MADDPELAAVESALSALALAETNGAIERVISRLLPGFLIALGSCKSARARTRIIQALQHINVRARGIPTLKLPFAAVLDAASSSTAGAMTVNVAIQGGYVERCYIRLSPVERTAAFSPLVRAAHSLRARSRANIDALLALAVRSIGAPRGRLTALEDTPESAIDALIEYSFRALRRTTKIVHDAEDLCAIVGLCSEYAGVKAPARAAKVFPHFLVAAGCASDSKIAEAGIDALKRVDATEELLEHRPELVDVFFDLFSEEDAHVQLRNVVLSKGLLRAPPSTNIFPKVLHVLRESVFSANVSSRMRVYGMQYLSYFIKHATQPVLNANEQELRASIMNVIDTPGTVPTGTRAFMYSALAQLIVRVPQSISDHDRFIPEALFTAAQELNEPAEVRSSASQALAILAETYGGSNSAQMANILVLLKQTVANQADEASGARATAVLWSNICFPFSNAQARLINIIASADKRTEVRDAAIAGLSPKKYRNLSLFRDIRSKGGDSESMSEAYPNFCQVVRAVRDESAASSAGTVLYPESWAAFFHFALRNLKENAKQGGSSFDMEMLAKYVENTPQVKESLNSLRSYADERIMGRLHDSTVRIKRSALCVVLTVARIESYLGVASVARVYSSQIPNLVENCTQCSVSGEAVIAEAFAALIGVASKALEKNEAASLLETLGDGLQPLSAGTANSRKGEYERIAKLFCLAYVISEHVRGSECFVIQNEILAASRKLLFCVQENVEPSSAARAAACRAVSLVGALGPVFSGEEVATTKSQVPAITRIADVVKSSKSEPVLVEVACAALGGICVGQHSPENISVAFKAIFDLAKDKTEDEIRFTAAECLVHVATGFNVPSPRFIDDSTKSSGDDDLQELLRHQEIPLASPQVIQDSESTAKVTIFDKPYSLDAPGILKACVDLSLNPRPHARASGGLFLFTFLNLIGSSHGDGLSSNYKFSAPQDQERFRIMQQHVGNVLPEAQRAFTTLLSDRSDLVQQIASRGISLVYELSPPSAKEDLVHTLIRSLTANKARAGSTVTGDEGGLVDIQGLPSGGGDTAKSTTGAANPGGATYKELCSLAQDLGQPDLVYKFMDLAGHTALWNSRRGAALAGTSLMDTDIAARQLQPHAKTLLPRLYVYCYDPSEGVRIAMSSVLRSVAKAVGHKTVSAAVNAFFDEVVQHCVKCIGGSQWRVREAGCAALRDALSYRKWEEVGERLKEFWYMALRALDDISERVRKQAWGLGQALSELSIFLCDPAQSGLENASKAVAISVPALLSAYTHSVDEVRKLARTTLPQILSFGGDALKHSVPTIVYRMLESATEVEAPVLNYAQFHIEQKEELESTRAKIASESSQPWVEALERIVSGSIIDEDVAKELVPQLLRLARSGVGVPTRAATARFFSSLLRSRRTVMGRHAHRLMKASMSSARMDRNPTLRTAWCASFGIAAGLSSVESVGKACTDLADLAVSDDVNDRVLASFLALGLWRESPDTAKKHATAILPIAFMGMFDTDIGDNGVSNWAEIWNEESEARLRIYAFEICNICVGRLESSQQYKVKQCAAVALGNLADASTATADVDLLSRAANALLGALPGRMFEGKAAIIDAIGSIASCDIAKSVWEAMGGISVVVNAALKECFRGKQTYRICALEALTCVLKSGRDSQVDFFSQIQEKLAPVWSNIDAPIKVDSTEAALRQSGSDSNAVDERNKARKTQRAEIVAALQCTEAAYKGSEAANRKDQSAYFDLLLHAVGDAVDRDRLVRPPLLGCMAAAVQRTESDIILGGDILPRLLRCADQGIQDEKMSRSRNAGMSLLEHIREKVGIRAFKENVGDDIIGRISSMAEKDFDPSVQAKAKKMKTVLLQTR